MYINSILSIEATFVNIMFQSRKQEDLNDTVSVRLSHTREKTLVHRVALVVWYDCLNAMMK